MRSRELAITDAGEIKNRLGKVRTLISDFTFANFFVFRNLYHYRLVRRESGHIFIAGTNPQNERIISPLGDPREIPPGTIATLMRDFDFFYPLDESWLHHFDDETFKISFLDSETDYVYRMEKISSFAGGKFNKRRNRLKQFLVKFAPETRALTTALRGDAIEVLNKWQAKAFAGKKGADYEPCIEALTWFGDLALSGLICYVQGEPAGFIIGEELNDKAFVVHFVKGLKRFHGLYEFLFNRFAQSLSAYEYLNLEEDLGDENLQITKGSYFPDLRVKKFRVSLRR